MKSSLYQRVINQHAKPIEFGCLLSASLILVCVGQAAAHEPGQESDQVSVWEFDGGFGHQSRYVSEGSNTVDHGGIATLELEVARETGIGALAVGVDFITGISVDFRETELGIGYEKVVGDVTASLSWVRVIEEEEDEKEYDTEWVAGFSYDGWEHVTPSIEYVHSTEADGALLVLMLEGEVTVGGLALSPYVLADVDYDYVSEGYDGLNHIEAGVEWEVSLSDDLNMTINAAYSMAQENLRREDEDNDYFWWGVGFSL